MPRFRYTIRTDGGAESHSAIAESAEALRQELAQRGLDVSGIEPDPLTWPATPSLSPADLELLLREMESMSRAGLPMEQGLEALAGEMERSRLRASTLRLAEALRAGQTLPEAMASLEGTIPAPFAAVVSAGVRSGRVPEVLGSLSLHFHLIAELRQQMFHALFYPGLVATFAFALCSAITAYLIPQFSTLFKDMGIAITPVTNFFIMIGQHPVVFFITPPLALVVGFGLLRLATWRSEAGERAWTRFIYSLPIIGQLVRSARLAVFADIWGILLEAGLTLPESILLAGATTPDITIRRASGGVARDLAQGTAFPQALRQCGLLPELLIWVAAVGERFGRLGPNLRSCAVFYRRRVEVRAALMRWALPSVIILLTAFFFGSFMILAVFVPLVRTMQGIVGL